MTPLRSVEEFDALRARPLAVVFKHSTACPLSARARSEVETVAESISGVEIHEVHVIENRMLSEHIARVTGALHESPQILLLRMGTLVWHDSHSGVTVEAIASAVARALSRCS